MPQLDFEGLGVKITALVQMQRATAIAAIVWMASAAHGAEVNLDGISDDDLAHLHHRVDVDDDVDLDMNPCHDLYSFATND